MSTKSKVRDGRKKFTERGDAIHRHFIREVADLEGVAIVASLRSNGASLSGDPESAELDELIELCESHGYTLELFGRYDVDGSLDIEVSRE